MNKKYRIVGVAFVPVEVEMVVEAESEEEAEAKAHDLDAKDREGNSVGEVPKLGDFVVPYTDDESAAFDLTINQVIQEE